jgi:hypothetical protein
MLRIMGFLAAIMNVGLTAYLVWTQFDVPAWGVLATFVFVLPVSALVAWPEGRYAGPLLTWLGISVGALLVLAGVAAIGLALLCYWGAQSEIVSGNYFPAGVAVPLVLMLSGSGGVILAKIVSARRRSPSS